ncbi:hypothetical protein BBJ28_00001752 [Nothophytophthora sp. Chile5]|nr:hypothetical protein BBJ28_00001752 [Nothophytophthora sp. Chile5]
MTSQRPALSPLLDAVAPPLGDLRQDEQRDSRRGSSKTAGKKRKPSYLVRQDEVKKLTVQLKTLQRQVAGLKARPRGPRAQILQALSTNSVLKDALHGQQLMIAASQSMMAELQENQPGNPLCTHIHLPKEWAERRQVLLSLKDDMILRGCQYVLARSQHLDLMKPQLMDHRYEDVRGDFCCERFEFFHFTGVESLKQVFDEVKFFMLNMEITISEALGHTTVREDYDSMDGDTSISNYRLLSTDSNGVMSEVNKIVMTKCFDQNPQLGGRPSAIMVTDSVDVDELYPYDPSKRIRRDVSATTILTEITRKKHKRPKTTAENPTTADADGQETHDQEATEEELVVVMQRAAFMKMHRPEFEIPKHAMRALKEGIASWGEVMVQSIRGAVNA